MNAKKGLALIDEVLYAFHVRSPYVIEDCKNNNIPEMKLGVHLYNVTLLFSVQTSMSGNSSKQQRVNGNGWRQGSGGAGRVRHKQLQQNGAIVSALRNVGQQGATPAGPSRDVTFDDRTETFGMEYEKG